MDDYDDNNKYDDDGFQLLGSVQKPQLRKNSAKGPKTVFLAPLGALAGLEF